MPIMIRIQEDCTPEVAAALDVLHKEMKNRNLKRNGKRPVRGGETRHDEIETAIIQALAPLQDTQDFGEVISKTNDYKQTLAHFAVHLGYTNLLRRLVGWNIDLTIADVNGSTALHCAYKKGDRACVVLLKEKGAPETVLDALGRAPSHLMPEGFASLSDHDANTASDGQLELEQKPGTPSTSPMAPPFAYGPSYVLWLLHLTSNLVGSRKYRLFIPRLKQIGSYGLALTQESSSACLLALVLQFSS